MSPDHCGSVGDERLTPKGNPLPGKYKHSFWRRSLAVPDDDELERFLASIMEQLEMHSRFFKDLVRTVVPPGCSSACSWSKRTSALSLPPSFNAGAATWVSR